MKFTRFAKYAWGVLAYNILVVLWGAYVRATGSGAGCGSHWPLCNGVVVPRAPQIETQIEFVHRITSGLSLLLVFGLIIWTWRAFPKGHEVRLGAGLSLLFVITEALVGAGLVLFAWVAKDESLGRVISMAVHLVNTFLLLASLALTAWWASGGDRVNLKGYRATFWFYVAGVVGVLLIGVTGAMTALGDTLYPSASLAEGVAQDFAPTAHFLVRLRIWHPIISALVGAFILFLMGITAMFRVRPRIRTLCLITAIMVGVQWIAGVVNLLLLAPVGMQIIHLLLAELLWLAYVIFLAANFGENEMYQNVPA
jgi:heme A synthase